MPVDWAMAISALSNSVKLVNDLRGIQKEFDQAEFKLKVAELNSSLADLKLTLADAKAEVADKDAEIERLQALLKKRSDTIEFAGFRYQKGDDGSPVGPPFCPVCEQKSGLLMLTVRTRKPGLPNECPNCKASYDNIRNFKYPEAQTT
jgi:septal ring factor EnvC (AmiA/AmiB activator)